ncbi:Alpha/Beta hydrolase protein [Paraphysoderma sedebokerense]|nr:Alpha/Beta hydrolase protein [Paraphysoderma sedebokerense]
MTSPIVAAFEFSNAPYPTPSTVDFPEQHLIPVTLLSKSGYLTIRGIHYFYRRILPRSTAEDGTREKTAFSCTIVLLHAMFSNVASWQFIMQELADKFDAQVIAYDRLSFGYTSRPTSADFIEEFKKHFHRHPYSNEEVFAVLKSFIDYFSDGQFTNDTNNRWGEKRKIMLIGNSLGGIIAANFCLQYPDLADKLVIIGSPLMLNPPKFILSFLQLLPIVNYVIPGVISYYIAKNTPDKWNYHNYSDLFHASSAESGKTSTSFSIELSNCFKSPDVHKSTSLLLNHIEIPDFKSNFFFESSDELEQSDDSANGPSKSFKNRRSKFDNIDFLVLWGKKDRVVFSSHGTKIMAYLEEVRQTLIHKETDGVGKIGKMEMILIDETGHHPHEEKPEEVLNCLYKFFEV